MAEVGFTIHQVVKFTAEKIALSTDPQTFQALYTARALSWGTPAYDTMAAAFDAFMAPYQAQAVVLTKPAVEKAVEKHAVNTEFNALVEGLKNDFDTENAADDSALTEQAVLDQLNAAAGTDYKTISFADPEPVNCICGDPNCKGCN